MPALRVAGGPADGLLGLTARAGAGSRVRAAWQTVSVSNDATTPVPDSPFRPEPGDRDLAPQFVLPLVVRIERAAPPPRTDALETAARAVLVMLGDERSTGDGAWARAMRDWQDARIRKVVRRARGAEWRRAEALPGITVTGKTAEVRVFRRSRWTAGPRTWPAPGLGHRPRRPGAPGDADRSAPVLWMNPDLDMSAGKAMAQAGHGAQLAWWELDDAARTAWREAGYPLAVRTPGPDHWRTLTTTGCRWSATPGTRRSRRGPARWWRTTRRCGSRPVRGTGGRAGPEGRGIVVP